MWNEEGRREEGREGGEKGGKRASDLNEMAGSGALAGRQKPPLGKEWLYGKLSHHPQLAGFGLETLGRHELWPKCGFWFAFLYRS